MKKLFITLGFAFIGLSADAQTNSFPKTPLSVVIGFYHELSLKPKDAERSAYSGLIFEKYFDREYVEYGGKGNKRQNFNEFKKFITDTFKQLPDLDVILEEILSDGDRVVVKIKLREEKAGVEINYLAFYFIKDGKIKNRYAYSDGGF